MIEICYADQIVLNQKGDTELGKPGMKLSDEERQRQIGERALYLSKHRELEGRGGEPMRDWLNAEWIQDNQGVHAEMLAAVKASFRKINGEDPTDETPLPTSDTSRERIVSLLKSEMPTLDSESAVEQSKTFAGIIEALVTQARAAAGR
jgi:hypothetical protein